MSKVTQSIRGYATLTIAMASACALQSSVPASASISEVRQLTRGEDSIAVRYAQSSTYVCVEAQGMWEKVSLADRSVQYRAEKPRTLDELFAKLSTPETERLSVQLRKQLGEPGAGEVASLQQLRLQAGMSQKQLAAVLGADQGYVSRLENGNIVDPSLSRARALAKALGVSIELIDLAFERFAESENNV